MSLDNIDKALMNWSDKEANYINKKNKIFGISPMYYLILIGILGFFFLRQTKLTITENNIENFSSKHSTINESEQNDNLDLYEMRGECTVFSAENFILFSEPDNESTILIEIQDKIDVDILNNTKYYFEVKFNYENMKYYGFINKKFFYSRYGC